MTRATDRRSASEAGGVEARRIAIAAAARQRGSVTIEALYGTEARTILRGASALVDLGEAFDGGPTMAEVDYLVAREWARSADDILWRRSKLGLRTGPESAARLAAYLTQKAEAA